MNTAIRVEGLSKLYRVNRAGGASPYGTLRESLMKLATAPFRRRGRDQYEDFWALSDVNFEVRPGEVVGIIGRNGAGKSTLLKILSRITRPTKGQVRLHGRVGSLLEVGTGFHPELTGRENIYLNGAILGMTRGEINRKFDDIVSFAELERFLDMPIKRYSSGMYVRLAFSVAAHINPEILLVDEVLAVGDAGFQKRCLGQMEAVARGGRTILFVSHQLEALLNLCPTSLLVEKGKLVARKDTRTIIDLYLAGQEKLRTLRLADRPDHIGRGRLRFTDTWIEDAGGRRLDAVSSGQTVKLVVSYEMTGPERVSQPGISFAIYTQRGTPITRLFSNVAPREGFDGELPAKGRFECLIPRLPLNTGVYVYNVMAETGPDCEAEDWIQGAGSFAVEQGDFFGTGKVIEPKFPALTDHSWRVTKNDKC